MIYLNKHQLQRIQKEATGPSDFFRKIGSEIVDSFMGKMNDIDITYRDFSKKRNRISVKKNKSQQKNWKRWKKRK
ncbi:TPA: hypothetical protein QCX05_004309 [Bacillus pacificus]|uniref:hypothetical protein n=1 Tax=unclassified Bacillus cereus group TaxID=2750818 RepID=UPI000B4B3152|nr:hypothetical protein [Bacillus cereus group sp. TH260-2LC]MDA1530382.1 hypothetical protein [Bacillus cereus group sp. TH260-2LC]PEB06050.1 hypothetical protein COM56_15775 [Bacillus cereus]HDR7249259.1 hypothetical protein [Bacillus pacificus]